MILYRNSMPELDLHGEDTVGARIRLKQFLDEQLKLRNEEVAIVHGIGKGILKKEVLDVLKKDSRIAEFNIDIFNEGCTLARFKIIDK